MIHVVPVPKDEDQFTAVGKEIYDAIKGYGHNMDVKAFLVGWHSGHIKVIVEKDEDIKGVCLMAIGQRWVDGEVHANLLLLESDNRPVMLEFCKNIASALSATKMVWDGAEMDELGNLQPVRSISLT